MIKWIEFLHLYQPPTQTSEILRQVTDESYSHILKLTEKYPNLRLTINISGSLLEKFQENNMSAILEDYKKLLDAGRIELTGSAMYHPILPLIPPEEVRNQIELNKLKFREIFGDSYKPKGFFLPEMAYSKEVAKIIKDAGFEWIILDEIHFPNEKLQNGTKYLIEDVGLYVIFRNRIFSQSFPPEYIITNLDKINDNYLITAHDGELYGHWHKEEKGYYDRAFKNEHLKTILVSEYLDELKKTQEIKVRNANWESKEDELIKGNFYSLWNNPKNKIQRKFWKLINLTSNILKENNKDVNFREAHKFYSRGIASCYSWWASERKIGAFSPESWNPTEIENGLNLLLRSIRSLQNLGTNNKIKVEKKFNKLRTLIWTRHWKKNDK